jgi:acyl carrier protein
MTAAPTLPGLAHLANLRRILATILGVPPSDIAVEHDFEDRLAMDELDLFELADIIERTYGIEVTEDDVQALATVGDLCALLALRNVTVIVP